MAKLNVEVTSGRRKKNLLMRISNTYLGNILYSSNADPLRLERTNSKQQGTRPDEQ